jgi:hypothetical protein
MVFLPHAVKRMMLRIIMTKMTMMTGKWCWPPPSREKQSEEDDAPDNHDQDDDDDRKMILATSFKGKTEDEKVMHNPSTQSMF